MSISVANNLVGQYPVGSVFCASGPTAIVDVTNPVTGKTWMDRNLGASQVATSSTDALAYGDLYQWGRGSDGHQCRNSGVTTTLSSTDQPGHGNFIKKLSTPADWRSPININLWQGVNGINNPCPLGYRIPTSTELNLERTSWISNNIVGAYNSQLKFIGAGFRKYDIATVEIINEGKYWSNTNFGSGTASWVLFFGGSEAGIGISERAYGYSVRCIKN